MKEKYIASNENESNVLLDCKRIQQVLEKDKFWLNKRRILFPEFLLFWYAHITHLWEMRLMLEHVLDRQIACGSAAVFSVKDIVKPFRSFLIQMTTIFRNQFLKSIHLLIGNREEIGADCSGIRKKQSYLSGRGSDSKMLPIHMIHSRSKNMVSLFRPN